MYENLLVPTDGSERAERAADHALDIASRYDAALHVVYVVDVGAIPPDVRSDLIQSELESEGRKAIRAIERRAREAGVGEVHDAIMRGKPASAIIDYAADNDIDLVVMGTHGRRGVNRYLLGSVTEKVVRSAEMPVLTVRAEDEG